MFGRDMSFGVMNAMGGRGVGMVAFLIHGSCMHIMMHMYVLYGVVLLQERSIRNAIQSSLLHTDNYCTMFYDVFRIHPSTLNVEGKLPRFGWRGGVGRSPALSRGYASRASWPITGNMETSSISTYTLHGGWMERTQPTPLPFCLCLCFAFAIVMADQSGAVWSVAIYFSA